MRYNSRQIDASLMNFFIWWPYYQHHCLINMAIKLILRWNANSIEMQFQPVTSLCKTVHLYLCPCCLRWQRYWWMMQMTFYRTKNATIMDTKHSNIHKIHLCKSVLPTIRDWILVIMSTLVWYSWNRMHVLYIIMRDFLRKIIKRQECVVHMYVHRPLGQEYWRPYNISMSHTAFQSVSVYLLYDFYSRAMRSNHVTIRIYQWWIRLNCRLFVSDML